MTPSLFNAAYYGGNMKNSAKIIAVCALVFLLSCGVCLGAYHFSESKNFSSGAVFEGTADRADYYSLSITPPSGNEYALFPMVLDYTVNGSAFSGTGAGLEVGIALSPGIQGFDLSAVAVSVECDVPADVTRTGDIVLIFSFLDVPEGTFRLSISVVLPEEGLELYRANGDRLFLVTTRVIT